MEAGLFALSPMGIFSGGSEVHQGRACKGGRRVEEASPPGGGLREFHVNFIFIWKWYIHIKIWMETWLYFHFLSHLPDHLSFYTAMQNKTIFYNIFSVLGGSFPQPSCGHPWIDLHISSGSASGTNRQHKFLIFFLNFTETPLGILLLWFRVGNTNTFSGICR